MWCRLLVRLLFAGSLLFSGAIASAGAPIVFGGDPAYPPYEWLEDGTPTGFHIDIEQAMAKAGAREARHRLAPWPETVDALKAGQVDVVPMFRSEKRKRDFWFSKPIYFGNHAIYTSRHPGTASSIQDLLPWRVAVERSSFAHDQLISKKVQLVLSGTTGEALDLLARGEADYAVLAAAPADQLVKRLNLPVRRVGLPLWPREYAFAVRKDRTDVADWVTQSLDEIVRDGTFHQIAARWRKHSEAEAVVAGSSSDYEGWILPALAALLLMLFGYGTARKWGRSERRGERIVQPP